MITFRKKVINMKKFKGGSSHRTKKHIRTSK
nr:MAG TPA: hypothetical protein [Bacteriophage sp.]